MAEDQDKRDEPNLELPSLFSRFTKKKRPTSQDPEGSADDASVEATTSETSQSVEAAETSETVETGEDGPTPTTAPIPTPVEGSTRRVPPTPPPPARAESQDTEPVSGDTTRVPEAEVATSPQGPDADSAPPVVEPTPQPQPEPTPQPDPEREPEPEPVTRAESAPESVPEPSPEPDTTTLPVTDDHAHAAAFTATTPESGEPLLTDESVSAEPRRRKMRTQRPSIVLPAVDARVAVAVTGVVVGLAGVLLAFAAGRGCEAVRGVGSCGGGVGVVALLAVLALAVALGSGLLNAWRIPNSTSTSILAVGLVAVAAMLFFLGALESAWMLLVVPVLGALAFLGSWWVSEVLVDPALTEDARR